jgi:Flp pilus assembly protein TadG
MRLNKQQRRGATLVESAFILPAALFLVFGLVIGGTGIFRYQEVAHLAREGARYASTHGGWYAQDGIPSKTGVSAVSSSTDLSNYLVPQTVMLDPTQLQVSVTWTGANVVTPANYPAYEDANPNLVPPGQTIIRNNVIVTVSYQWMPYLYLVGPITLTSTAQMAMSY